MYFDKPILAEPCPDEVKWAHEQKHPHKCEGVLFISIL
ncbi:hypothetical protein C2W64_02006 [Brevibacillus laterosporus]|nr:hypothetical protein C2W64_02006 [Brevibacillus laterosporus]